MKLPALTVHQKLAIPLTLLYVLVIVIIAVVAIRTSTRSLEIRMEEQIEQTSAMFSRTDFALNEAILRRLKAIIDAEVVTYQPQGEVLASTLDSASNQELLRQILEFEPAGELFSGDDELIMREVVVSGTPYKIAFRHLQTTHDAVVAFAVNTEAIRTAEERLTRYIIGIAAIMLMILGLVSYLITLRTIYRPLSQLVTFTQKIGAGDRPQSVGIKGRDEVGQLALAFEEMAAQLKTFEEKLVNSEKMALTGQLTARVAHEVRNPLSAIKMQTQLLRGKLLPEAKNERILNEILREIDRLEWVVKGVLSLASPGRACRSPQDINRVLGDLLDFNSGHLAHRKVQVDRQFGSDLPPIELDPDQMKQALLNLILNAADAMPTGGNMIVRTGLSEEAGELTVEVCDEGSGIDPGISKQVFDPFFTTKPQGVGLGLLNTRTIVEQHGGRVELKPCETGGTRAIIHLRLTAETLAESEGRANGNGSSGR